MGAHGKAVLVLLGVVVVTWVAGWVERVWEGTVYDSDGVVWGPLNDGVKWVVGGFVVLAAEEMLARLLR